MGDFSNYKALGLKIGDSFGDFVNEMWCFKDIHFLSPGVKIKEHTSKCTRNWKKVLNNEGDATTYLQILLKSGPDGVLNVW